MKEAAPPPAAAVGSEGMAAAAMSAARSASASAASSAVRRRPGWLILIPTFAATHFALAWALVPPIYLFLRQTNLSNALMAGPQGAWFLSRKVPSWVPGSLVDGVVGSGGGSAQSKQHQELTVEQVIERLARRGINLGWTYGGALFKSLRQLQQGDTEAVAIDAVRKLSGGGGDGSVSKSIENKKEVVEEHARGIKDRVWGYTSRRARSAADEIQITHIRDGIAAWVLVKLLLPLRLPVSLFMTPKVARAMVKAFGRAS